MSESRPVSDDPPEDPHDLTPEEIAAREDPNNAANPVAVRRKAKATNSDAKTRAEMISGMLDVEHGRKFLGWLVVDVCGLYSPLADAVNSIDGLQAREGSRRVGLILDEACAKAAGERYAAAIMQYRKKQGYV